MKKSVGGGKGFSILAKIPIPELIGGEGKSLAESLYGSSNDRTDIPNPKNNIENTGNFGQIDDVVITTTFVNTLRGRLYKPRPQDVVNGRSSVVLFCSGSGGSAEKYGESVAQYYITKGVPFLAVNYRGFGASSGSPSESGLYDDAYHMYRYLRDQNYAVGDIIVHGYSLGGPVAASLVKTQAKKGKYFRGLVLQSPMPSLAEASASEAGLTVNDLPIKLAVMALGSFDLRKKLERIEERRPALPIVMVSGEGNSGDQLDIRVALGGVANSLLTDVQNLGLTNFEYAIANNADHEDATAHMTAAHQYVSPLF